MNETTRRAPDASDAPASPDLRSRMAPTGPRRRGRWIASAVLLVLAGTLAAAAVQILAARSAMISGAQALRAAAALAGDGSHLRDGVTRYALTADLRAARHDFGRALDDLTLWHPVLDQLGFLPGPGPEIASAWTLAGAARSASAAALEMFSGTSGVWRALPQPGSGRPLLPAVLPGLAAGRAAFAAAERDAQSARRALHAVPAQGFPAGIATDLIRLRSAVTGLIAAARWLGVAPQLLGWRTPSTILVAFEDQRELRATGGFIGAANLLTIRDGVISTAPTGSELPKEQPMAVPYPEAVLTAESSLLFRDANFSPSFPLSARFERALYGRDTARWPDIVVNVLDGASAVLNATGPVYLPDFKQTVSAANVQQEAIHYIYDTYHARGSGAQFDANRVRFLGSLTSALISRIQGLTIPQFLALGGDLHRAIVRRQFLIWARNSAVERVIAANGAAGNVPNPPNDSIYVVDDNRSYSKLNPYVLERATYHVALSGSSGLARSTLTLRYHVLPSPGSIEGFGPVFGAAGTKHDYLDFVRILVPAGARLEGVSGSPFCPLSLALGSGCRIPFPSAPAYGLTQLAAGIMVREGSEATLRFRYVQPLASVVGVDGRYHLSLRAQPGTNVRAVTVSVTAGGGLSRARMPGATSRRLVLGPQGASIAVSLAGHTPAHIATRSRGRPDYDPYLTPLGLSALERGH